MKVNKKSVLKLSGLKAGDAFRRKAGKSIYIRATIPVFERHNVVHHKWNGILSVELETGQIFSFDTSLEVVKIDANLEVEDK